MSETHWLVVSRTHPYWGGAKPAIQVCALEQESNPRHLAIQAGALTTEPPSTALCVVLEFRVH